MNISRWLYFVYKNKKPVGIIPGGLFLIGFF